MNNFQVNCRASIRIQGERAVFYVDPFKIVGEPKDADVIFITHSHWDHLSIDDIKKVMSEKTYFIAPVECMDKISESGIKLDGNFTVITDKSFNMDGTAQWFHMDDLNCKFYNFLSYNIGKPFHPKSSNYVGYVLIIDGKTFCVCGDTDVTPELENLKDIDVLFIPIGGRYTMGGEEAAALTNKISPKIVVPIHYMFKARDNAEVMGDKNTEKEFIEKLGKGIDCKVVLNKMEN